MLQYNGYNSCTYCLDAGEHVSGRHIFPPESEHEDRTASYIEECAVDAEASGNPVCGVKGRSVLSAHIDIPQSVVIDYMHAILEGVTETLLSACLDSKHSACRFFLGHPAATKEIDKRLHWIKPPYEFHRTPRSITSFKYWKASEFRAWLLYYSLPVLSDLLPPDYIYHLSLLVSATHCLLGDAIYAPDIDMAHDMLQLFTLFSPYSTLVNFAP